MVSLASEVEKVKSELRARVSSSRSDAPAQSAVTQCPFCPFRWFNRTRKTLAHIESHHKESNRFCPSGGKQFRIICSLFDSHQVRRQHTSSLLEESASLLRQTVIPPLSRSVNYIDEEIRLVFHTDGPQYQSLESIEQSKDIRRRDNLYYTRGFANLLLHEIIENDSNLCRATHNMVARTCEATNPLASMYRTHSRYWWPVVEDIMSAPPVLRLMDEFKQDMMAMHEYELVTVDDTGDLHVCPGTEPSTMLCQTHTETNDCRIR